MGRTRTKISSDTLPTCGGEFEGPAFEIRGVHSDFPRPDLQQQEKLKCSGVKLTGIWWLSSRLGLFPQICIYLSLPLVRHNSNGNTHSLTGFDSLGWKVVPRHVDLSVFKLYESWVLLLDLVTWVENVALAYNVPVRTRF
ncbi:unnamed protein product [Allacma fusca]|uniref:Uncharacterized protein n=1 Tax=Allacma fusca TaxID=39272 RepID=A0A8J2LV31_9HEXA|nr:unnamed protein product [Allacma fusca]